MLQEGGEKCGQAVSNERKAEMELRLGTDKVRLYQRVHGVP